MSSLDVPGGQARVDAHESGAPGGHVPNATHPRAAPGGHRDSDAQKGRVPGGHPSVDIQVPTAPGGQRGTDSHSARVPGGQEFGGTHDRPAPEDTIAYEMLAFHAAMLDEAEHARIAAGNRLRAMLDPAERNGAKGLNPALPEVAAVRDAVGRWQAMEHGAELNLKRALRAHPLGSWIRRTVGIGEKQGARLLAAIGDPAWNGAEGRPRRGPAELWAYCGLHVVSGQWLLDVQEDDAAGSGHPGGHQADAIQLRPAPGVAPRRMRGQRANWSSTARSRAFLVAESCIKQAASPYRAVYEAGRAKYADAVHQVPCLNTARPPMRSNGCGTHRVPAPVGSPLRAGHQHMRALRLVAKTVVRDLWLEARRLQDAPGD